MAGKVLAAVISLALLLGGVYLYLLMNETDKPAVQPKQVSKTGSANSSTEPITETPAEAAAKRLVPTAVGSQTEPSAPAIQRPEPFKDWPVPAVALLLTGEQHGYIEPCGCSAEQLGGVSRRANLLAKMKAKSWPVVAVDLGGLINRARVARPQTESKFKLAHDALKGMGYAAVGMGVEELKLNPALLLGYHDPEKLPFVCCNIVLFDTPGEGVSRFRIVEAGGLKIAITGVLGDSFKPDVFPEEGVQNVTFSNPTEELTKVLAEIDAAGADVRVLLSNSSVEESKKLIETFPQFDVVMTAGGPGEPDPTPLFVGKTLLAMTGEKGKHTGVVGVFPKDEKQKLRYELVDIDPKRFDDTPEMRALMAEYQDVLKLLLIAENDPAVDHPSGTEFVGAETCGKCHTKAYAKWETSRHAHALESLKTGRKGEEATWISRIHDPECLACHVTGWSPTEYVRFTSGYSSETATPHLLGQQCENCHGPGKAHVDAEYAFKKSPKREQREAAEKQRGAMHLDKELVSKRGTCIKCHDGDNSPNFNFETYWPKVAHPGRD